MLSARFPLDYTCCVDQLYFSWVNCSISLAQLTLNDTPGVASLSSVPFLSLLLDLSLSLPLEFPRVSRVATF